MDPSLEKTEYDVILIGTGMVEAILAGAFARIGKTILHLDQNDYYGSNYASFPMAHFRKWLRNEPLISPDSTLDPLNIDTSKQNNHSKSQDYEKLPIVNTFKCQMLEEFFLNDEIRDDFCSAKNSFSFSIDLNPRLILSNEELVQTLVTSGVGRYLEFVALERTYMMMTSVTSVTSSENANSNTDIWEVPCSKKDVFQSKLLSMVEKRMLMKFLQFVNDYGEMHFMGENIETQNERQLTIGRSLKRPQNKTNQMEDISEYLHKPFQVLLEKHFKLSKKLQNVVLYCVALASLPNEQGFFFNANQIMNTEQGLKAVHRYVSSIGKYTGNAFLVPLYGVSEIAQSFCRLAAVYGGVYVLKASLDSFLIEDSGIENKKRVVGIQAQNGTHLKASHVIMNASYSSGGGSVDQKTTTLRYDPQLLRAVFLLNKPLQENKNRILIVIPPGDSILKNKFAIHIIQLDSGCYVCPKGYFLVHVTTPFFPSEEDDCTGGDADTKSLELMNAVIDRLLKGMAFSGLTDSSLSSSQEEKCTQAEDSEDVVEKQPTETEAQDLTGTDTSLGIENDANVSKKVEPDSSLMLWKVVYKMPLYMYDDSNVPNNSNSLFENLYLCENGSLNLETETERTCGAAAVSAAEIHFENAMKNAYDIFKQICPNDEFLPKSASAEQAEKEEAESMEQAVLEAAKKIAEQQQAMEQVNTLIIESITPSSSQEEEKEKEQSIEKNS